MTYAYSEVSDSFDFFPHFEEFKKEVNTVRRCCIILPYDTAVYFLHCCLTLPFDIAVYNLHKIHMKYYHMMFTIIGNIYERVLTHINDQTLPNMKYYHIVL